MTGTCSASASAPSRLLAKPQSKRLMRHQSSLAPHPPAAQVPPSPRMRREGGGEGQLADRILYRDGLILVINKPAGIAVHPGPGGGPDVESGFDALRFGLPHPPRLAHP